MQGQSVIVGGGIQAGAPFALGHLVFVTNVQPPQLTTFAPTVVSDSVSAVVYLNVPNSAAVSVATNQNATETLRIKGGMIVEGAGLDSVQIGRGAVAPGVGQVVIGLTASFGASTKAGAVLIGRNANGAGSASVVIGDASGSGVANPVSGVFIGATAQASGNAGGANVVVIGDSALITLGNAGGGGGVAIGFSATIAHPSGVAIGYSAQSTFSSTLGQNTVTIGDNAVSTQAGTTIVGGAATTTQFTSIVIGSGATITKNSASGVGSIVIGQTANTTQDKVIVVGTNSVLTSSSSACFGHGCRDMGANVIQFGGPNGAYNVIVLGQGDTVASPAAKGFRFTNASGTDNAAGDFTLQAPLSTGNATPARVIISIGQQVAGSSGTVQTASPALTFSNTTAGGHVASFTGAVATGAPSGGTAAQWRFGIIVAAVSALDTRRYVQLDVGGTLVKVALIT